ncbi:TPA: hypothetical protein N2898_004516 [Vibrio parahaemolyticus]|uniref:hypothetical protein n=1 Tax=Vibrio parahaemolyticus TaxID=670 RepID=UPI0011200FDC|nr:hypothetical protein [Vibrio parahaemolyticus]TOI26971.1 hypothetical protein CGI63_23395 [Vibrio parahaemolyticus]HCG8547420.1 hypothetical protein [Vibrio parahaemolyticus]HCH0769875.1 hypothetical protein [Vibrio parahaemolyticus]HCH1004661.1 hypothetical protein [Vibrio parahaemolyticus]HCM1290415.1 hypothetical protein [Vibrio parahaemolyticus]
MAIKNIENLSLYYSLEGGDIEKVGGAPFPMVTLLSPTEEGQKIVAAIKFSKRKTGWHVDNVAALDGYGPTVYKVLMQISGQNGIAPCYKPHYQQKEFVAEKSKRIWAQFHSDADVVVRSIPTHYKDNNLNHNFILNRNCFDIEASESNLTSYIESCYFSKLSWFEKIKHKCCGTDDEALSEFNDKVIPIIHEQTKQFLESSVEVHHV